MSAPEDGHARDKSPVGFELRLDLNLARAMLISFLELRRKKVFQT
jgi:hypothetical protein